MSRVNLPIIVIGIIWWYMETKYFGWNTVPGSVSELFADGMALSFFALAFAFPPKKDCVTNVSMQIRK